MIITSSTTATTTTASATPASGPAGPGCAAYEQQVPTGPGSISGMTKDPVTVAASNNPKLTTLTNAISGKLNPGVNLVDTLNKGEYTVFAPTDDAFAKLDPATTDRLKTDAPFLNSILTYHVVNGPLTLAQADGVHQTLDANTTLTVTGTADDLKVNDAGVICGGISTANAQVYMIDTVLMPPPGP
ncbi:MAG: fasciclin domain-containing protein [Mycobacterium sp.]